MNCHLSPSCQFFFHYKVTRIARVYKHAATNENSLDLKPFKLKLVLPGSFLIKFSSLSAPTKIEDLTAGSDEKTQRRPTGDRTQGLASSDWLERATGIRKILGLIPGGPALCFLSAHAVSYSTLVGAEREENLIRNDPGNSEFTIEWI